MTTIVDVARSAGVSTSTVSRVLNGNQRVDPALAATVLRVVRKLNYRPSRAARSLRLGRTPVWALVISDIRTGPFFAEVVRGVEDVAYEAGYSVILCNSDEDLAKEASYLQLAASDNVAGVILTPSSEGTDLTSMATAGIHVVLADRKIAVQQFDAVVADNMRGSQEAVRHLVGNGYRRIACIMGPLSTTTGSERYQGYLQALRNARIRGDASWVRTGDFKESGGYRAMRELLDLHDRPDAVFITNNRMTAGALQAIAELGLQIPEDMAVVGYDEIAWAPLLKTGLTTVGQPAYDLGFESARLLLSRLKGYSGSPRTVVLPTTLNVRASSGPGISQLRRRSTSARVAASVSRAAQ